MRPVTEGEEVTGAGGCSANDTSAAALSWPCPGETERRREEPRPPSTPAQGRAGGRGTTGRSLLLGVYELQS